MKRKRTRCCVFPFSTDLSTCTYKDHKSYRAHGYIIRLIEFNTVREMAKRKKESAPALAKHRHCPVCGLPIELDKQFCGDTCKAEFEKASKKRRTQLYAFFLIYVLIFLFVIFIAPLLFPKVP